jgi:gamma-butyrobetaine dioxygenase
VRVQDLACGSGALSITWDNGLICTYPAIWLYDNKPEHRDAHTGQRWIDVADLPPEPRIKSGHLVNTTIHLTWVDESLSEYKLDWLLRHSPAAFDSVPERYTIQTWGGADRPLLDRYSFEEVSASRDACQEWLERIAVSGIGFLSGVPAEENAVLEVAAMIGWVRDTNYGRVFDVRAVPDPNNLAYTGVALGLHTDNPYREPVPGLQILHCVMGSPEGGTSMFADGFRAAGVLQSRDPEAFEILSSTPVGFEFSDVNTHLSARRPLIQCSNGAVEAIHYNNRSMAPLQMPDSDILRFYRAYRSFAMILRETAQTLTTSLSPGDAVVFNNRRILHGRTAFPANERRLLQGCYLEHDGLWSRIAVLRRNGPDSRNHRAAG